MVLDNDEIEVACDAVWYAKLNERSDPTQRLLWDRLQVIRTGDVGGRASTKVSPDEIAAIVRALRLCATDVGLEDEEQALLTKLTS